MKPLALDVEPLPRVAFGHRGLMWWGTVGIIAIEGTMFALAIVNYLFLKGRVWSWPPGVMPPDLGWGTLNTALLLASAIPNELTKRAAQRFDLQRVRRLLLVCLGFGVAFNVVRVLEFGALNVWWDTNAYGSAVWLLLGLHTAHILTDVLDTAVLTVLLFVGPVEDKHFVDVSENALYWYFVIVAWLPIYGLLYFAPRLA